MTLDRDMGVPAVPIDPPASKSFWITLYCEWCGRAGHTTDAASLPPQWESHQYTGETICDLCAEKGER